MELLSIVIVGVYILGLIYITIFCLMQFHLLIHYKRSGRTDDRNNIQLDEYPTVTIQLPVFNEKYVIQRLIDRICEFDYPRDRMEIQILDDSTDETVDLALEKVNEYRNKGFDIKHIHRVDRKGFKAGALKEGMKSAKGEFVAIFDADFLPHPLFLKRTLPFFRDPKIGVVQTRWEHINQDYSLITRLQAFQLNVHFTVEQMGRYKGNYLLQFNGTAGVWRKTTIDDAGGWEADTLTEDLDLSIRAQLNGWKIKYLEDFTSPAELPAEMNGLKSQQFRWMKGGAETAVKMLPTVWKSGLSLKQKMHSTMHLLSSGIFLFVFLVGVFSVPVLYLVDPLGVNVDLLSFCLIGLLSIILVYYVANVQTAWKELSKPIRILKFLALFPIFLSLSMGLSLHNSIAVIQGYIGRKTPFVRTPKFNIQSLTDRIGQKNYLRKKLPLTTVLEGLLALYFIGAIVISMINGQQSFLLFHILLAFGYGTICFFSIKHLKLK